MSSNAPSPSSPLPVPQRNSGTSSMLPLPACSPPPHMSWRFSLPRYSNSHFFTSSFHSHTTTTTTMSLLYVSSTPRSAYTEQLHEMLMLQGQGHSPSTEHASLAVPSPPEQPRRSLPIKSTSLTLSSHHRHNTTHQGFTKATAPVSPGKRRTGWRDDWWYHVRSPHLTPSSNMSTSLTHTSSLYASCSCTTQATPRCQAVNASRTSRVVSALLGWFIRKKTIPPGTSRITTWCGPIWVHDYPLPAPLLLSNLPPPRRRRRHG
jgi:hypothetical protein